MDQTVALLLSIQSVCFALWAVLSYRALFQIRAIAAGRSGQVFPGPVTFLSAMGVWLNDPAHRTVRILWLLALVGTMAPSIWIALTSDGLQ